ncbi:MAG: thioredoxin [Rhodospirillales bacterium]|nr:thioredoxin [Rhodospirillales bacterium]
MDILFGKGANAGGGAEGGALIKESDTQNFMADVIQASQQVPVIVDFWAPWCGPCKQLGPMLEKAVKEARGAVRMVKVNVDQNQELAAQLRVQSIPAVYAFKGGRPVDAFVGALPESQIKSFVKRLITGGAAGPTLDDILEQAKEIMAEGDVATAAEIYRQVLAEEAGHPVALAGLMRCMIAAGDAAGAERMLDDLPPEAAKHPDVAAVRTQLELAAQAGKAGSTADLRRRLSADPEDHQARFDLALAYYAAGEREAAVDELLELVRRDRAWNEEGARKQLVKLFEAFGPTDPLTVSARRRLSSILFS